MTTLIRSAWHKSAAPCLSFLAALVVGACNELATGPDGHFGPTHELAPAALFTNACTNSAGTTATQLEVDLSGTAPTTVSPGESFTLSGLDLMLSLPGTFFVAGYNLGLLQTGANVLPGNVVAVIEGTNTIEGIQLTPVTAIAIGTVITDPDGVPGSGDETASPGEVDVSFPNQTWTAGASGTILFREETVPLAPNSGGIVINVVIGGFLNLQFRCSPGTVGTDDAITLIDPAPSFAEISIVGNGDPPPPSEPVGDIALDVIVNGPTMSTALYTNVVAKLSNVGASPFLVCDTDILWDIEVNGVNTTGFVLPSDPGCRTLAPGRAIRFRFRWVHGPGELTRGATVEYKGALSLTDDDPSNNADTEFRTAS